MLIGSRFKVESDSLNVTLYRKAIRTSKKDKQEYISWEVLGYYSTVENALIGMVDFGIKETQLKDVKAIDEKIKELKGYILKLSPKALQSL